jgi:hypothetical protein
VFNLTSYVDERTCDNVFERKIEDVTSDLLPSFQKILYKISKENAWIIANYIISMRTEINLADNYRLNIIKELANFSIFCNNKSFKQVTRDDLISFLDSFRKSVNVDPLHKWVGTYNTYRIYSGTGIFDNSC